MVCGKLGSEEWSQLQQPAYASAQTPSAAGMTHVHILTLDPTRG